MRSDPDDAAGTPAGTAVPGSRYTFSTSPSVTVEAGVGHAGFALPTTGRSSEPPGSRTRSMSVALLLSAGTTNAS